MGRTVVDEGIEGTPKRKPMPKLSVAVLFGLLPTQLAVCVLLSSPDWTPSAVPTVSRVVILVYFGLAALVVLAFVSLARRASSPQGRAVAGLMCAVGLMWLMPCACVSTPGGDGGFFTDTLKETKTWPELPGVEVYVYRDSFRGKTVTAKVRNGGLPIMHEVAHCMRSVSVRRENTTLVFECSDRIARYDTNTSSLRTMELNEPTK
jgi:hypothetical protein